MRYRSMATLAGILVAGGCASANTLHPAPGANALPAPMVGAYATDAGVRLEARTKAWSGMPANLPLIFTPILVHVANNGTQPLMIRYSDFTLHRTDSGETWAAIPPFQIDKTVTVEQPYYRNEGFEVAPYLRAYYPGWAWYQGFPDFDLDYFNRYYPEFGTLRLPTPDMLAAALPEGVLRPGGTMTGYLYFQHMPDTHAPVLLQERLEAPGGQTFGRITLPFEEAK